MAPIIVKRNEPGSCNITHSACGAEINTDSSPEFGGKGRAFSATDLVVAAVGACIMTSIDKVAERGGLDPQQLEITLDKSLATQPKWIEAIEMVIRHPAGFDPGLLIKLERAARSCAVKRSLHPDMNVTIRFE